jgi:hypothetical protein
MILLRAVTVTALENPAATHDMQGLRDEFGCGRTIYWFAIVENSQKQAWLTRELMNLLSRKCNNGSDTQNMIQN